MDQTPQTPVTRFQASSPADAWNLVTGQLRMDMSRTMYETWVQPLKPLELRNGEFLVGAVNSYARDWVESHLQGRINGLLGGVYTEPVRCKVVVANSYAPAKNRTDELTLTPAPQKREPARKGRGEDEPAATDEDADLIENQAQPPIRTRKVMLQRAYGSERARVIQPERGMFVTLYFFNNWLPLLGHSAYTVILAARSMCYWNPMTGELRNTLETEMSELARRAAVSVRTVKDVLNNELVQKYFLRYKVRRMMTPNGVRTAGILLLVRMDDPLTPQDQESSQLAEDDRWYLPDFADDDESDEENQYN